MEHPQPGSVISPERVVVIAAKPSEPGTSIILGLWNEATPYAVWKYDHERDALYRGFYTPELEEALTAFKGRA